MPVTYDPRLKRAMQHLYLARTHDGNRWSPASVLSELEARKEQLLADGLISSGLPNEKTLRRWADEADEWSEDEKKKARRARWPESFDQGLLPHEYAPAFFSLLNHETQPSIRRARWHWRIVSAAPEMPEDLQRALSQRFSVKELVGTLDEDALRSLEYFLAFRGWADEDTYAERIASVQYLRPEIDKLTLFGIRDYSGPEGLAVLMEIGLSEDDAQSLLSDSATVTLVSPDEYRSLRSGSSASATPRERGSHD